MQMERWRRWSRWKYTQWVLIFEKIFTGFVGPPSPSTLCAGPAYPHRSIQPGMNQWERAAREPSSSPGQPGSAAAGAIGIARSSADAAVIGVEHPGGKIPQGVFLRQLDIGPWSRSPWLLFFA